jgi:hypothetical protein
MTEESLFTAVLIISDGALSRAVQPDRRSGATCRRNHIGSLLGLGPRLSYRSNS